MSSSITGQTSIRKSVSDYWVTARVGKLRVKIAQTNNCEWLVLAYSVEKLCFPSWLKIHGALGILNIFRYERVLRLAENSLQSLSRSHKYELH